MSFFSTFSEISKNQGKFKQWEQQKADQEAKREKYFAQNPTPKNKINEAKELGRVVVDTVDFMDAQSENKSESVEMATEMTTGIAGAIGSSAALVIAGKNHKKNTDALKETLEKLNTSINELSFEQNKTTEQNAVIKDLVDNRLAKQYGDSNHISLKYSLTGVEILKEKNYNKLKPSTKEYFKDIINNNVLSKAKKAGKGLKNIALASTLTGLGIGIIGQIAGTMLQIKASRVARYQARENLKDTKNFVEYTDEQKEEAKKHVGNIKIEDEKKSGSIKDIRSILKDYKNYEAESEKLNATHLYDVQESDPQKGYEKQHIVNNIIKKINNSAENYAQNMETAAGVILGCSVLGGALFGAIAEKIIKITDKANHKRDIKTVEKSAEEIAQKAPQKLNMFKNLPQKFLKFAKTNPKSFGSILATLIAIPISTKLTKEASRAGRFKAKRELEENPENFIYLDEQKLSTVQGKGKVDKDSFLDVVKFVPESIKTIHQYKKYKKTTLKQRKAMHEALKQTNISEQQMQDAKALQQRLYKSFDVIDDHSEEYSEKMEAAGEVTKDIFTGVIMPAAFAIPGIMIAKNPHKVIKPATELLAGVFKNFKGFAKKYASNIGENAVNKMTKKVKNTWDYQELSFVEKEIDEILKTTDKNDYKIKMQALKEKMKPKLGYRMDSYIEQIQKFKGDDFVEANGEKIVDAIRNIPNENAGLCQPFLDKILESHNINKRFIELNEEELIQHKNILTDAINNLPDYINGHISDNAKKQVINIIENPRSILERTAERATETLPEGSMKELAKLLDTINDPKVIKEELKKITNDMIDVSKISDTDILKIKNNIKTALENLPEEEFVKSMKILNDFHNQKTMQQMILANNSYAKIKPQEIFITKDIQPIYLSVIGAYVASIIGITYSVESFLASKQKQAGRLGTMKAIQDLDAENDKYLEINKTKRA